MRYFSNTRKMRKTLVFTILSVMLVTNGCGGKKFPVYSVKSIRGRENFSANREVSIFAEPMNKKACQKYFGTNLLSKNILPVFVNIKNTSCDKTFLVQKSYFSLRDISKASLNSDNEQRSIAAIGLAGAIVAPISMVLTAGLISDSMYIEQNVHEKEFKRRTIPAGEEAQGFIYFQYSKKEKLPEKMTLEVTALDIKSSKKIKHNVIISFKE